jgi:Glycosyl hydrolase catalytic core
MAQADSECLRSEWLAVHWFDIPSFDLFRDTLVQYHLQYERPLILTEFAPIDPNATSIEEHRWSKDDILAFMKEALPWLESTPWIQGYAWFAFDISDPVGTSSALFDSQGDLTDCGRYYAAVQSDGPNGVSKVGISCENSDCDHQQDSSSCKNRWNSDLAPPPLELLGKKGLSMQPQAAENAIAWLRDIADMTQMNVSWTFNFHSPKFHDHLDHPIFLPAIADEPSLAFHLSTLLNESISVNRVLGFDSPDRDTNDDDNDASTTFSMSVELALDLWDLLESTNLPLVSPSCIDPLGQWMKDFMAVVDRDCRRVDWIGVRWQASVANFYQFRESMELIHATYQRPIMITALSLDQVFHHHSAAEVLGNKSSPGSNKQPM